MICRKNGSSESVERPTRQSDAGRFSRRQNEGFCGKRWNAQKGDVRLSVARASSFFWWSFGADGAVYLGGTLSRLDARVSGAPRGICRVAVIELRACSFKLMNQLLLYDDAYYGASNNGISSNSTWIYRQYSYYQHRRIVGDQTARTPRKIKQNRIRPVLNLESIPNLSIRTKPQEQEKEKKKEKTEREIKPFRPTMPVSS